MIMLAGLFSKASYRRSWDLKYDLCCRLKEDEFETSRRLRRYQMEKAELRRSRPHLTCKSPVHFPWYRCETFKPFLTPISSLLQRPILKGDILCIFCQRMSHLLASFVGSKDAEDFCLNLFEAYPEAIITRDNTDAFPFVHLIRNWVEDSYHRMNQHDTSPRRGLIRTIHSSKGKLNSLFRSDSKRTMPEIKLETSPVPSRGVDASGANVL